MLNSAGSSSFFRKLLYPLFDLIINIFKNRIDKIIASSNTELNEFKKRIRLPSEKFSLIRLGVDLEQIKEIQVKPKKNQIISVGRLVKNKGFHHLIDAIKKVKNKKPNIKLIIVGKGPFEEKLKKQVIKHGLHENVLFIGSIPFNERKKLIKLIKESSLFVLLSDYEGAPISVLLAVACKTPILLNNKGVLAEHVKEFKAIGCNSRNHEEVAEKIISILNKPEDFIPESHKIQDIKESCKKIIELYKELNSLNQTNIKY
jgi:glycosyltransferase involved in cell wall biosynthesis